MARKFSKKRLYRMMGENGETVKILEVLPKTKTTAMRVRVVNVKGEQSLALPSHLRKAGKKYLKQWKKDYFRLYDRQRPGKNRSKVFYGRAQDLDKPRTRMKSQEEFIVLHRDGDDSYEVEDFAFRRNDPRGSIFASEDEAFEAIKTAVDTGLSPEERVTRAQEGGWPYYIAKVIRPVTVSYETEVKVKIA